MDLTWSQQTVRSQMLPGEADLAHEWASQPQLPAGSRNQPAPAISCVGVARANSSPAQRLLEKAERMLDGEAPQIPAPQHAQVSRQWTADPGQPERPRWQPFIGQTLDLDADHAEWRIWSAAHMELGPQVDADDAVRRVVQLSRSLRLAIRGFVGQPKWLTMQTWATAAGVFTRNKVRAAPVKLSEERLRSGRCQAVIVNSGNANAATGRRR